jgi:hypothetical protein
VSNYHLQRAAAFLRTMIQENQDNPELVEELQLLFEHLNNGILEMDYEGLDKFGGMSSPDQFLNTNDTSGSLG